MSADRAAVTTTAILQIVRVVLHAWLDHGRAPVVARAAIEDLLRDEFADVANTAVSEIRPNDE